ncbi:acyl-CoA carboxylase subunit beta [Nocardia huaxiensis]|uniref:acyl-CoA carboxylase subunit beta n=1 Tax=Nocardia huaxiensis TaxID=2755382 RepID=UPI001E4FB3DA|nr:acyl-CoA carboxylase subunit beta [Nocardia huaxiensis]UFS98608.1 acyl-CoA carboxylase subunit beta [Nocardia huaxiensis]
MSTTAEKLADLHKRLEIAKEPAGQAGISKRAAKGIPSARERVEMLLDPGTFVELDALAKQSGADALYGDGVVTGHGRIDGRPVVVMSHDQTVYGGSVGEIFGRKVEKAMQLAQKMRMPFIGINDSGGARIQEAATSLAWYARMGRTLEPLSGFVPRISIMLGKCAAGSVYAPINTDVLVATKDSYMFVTGPEVIRDATGQHVDIDELGGAYNQAEYGNLHHVAEDEAAAYAWVRQYLSYMPSSCLDAPMLVNPGLEPQITDADLLLDSLIPDSDNSSYDMHDVLLHIFDDGEFHEVAAQRAKNIIIGFARVDGKPVGVIANQPLVMAGAVDARACDKAAHFIQLCDAFNIPLIFVVDTPGVLPGVEEEKLGVIKRGGRFLITLASATVPIVTIVIRKAYGGAYALMGCKQLGADINLAWPTARIAVMGAESAVGIMGRKQLAAAPEDQRAAIRQQMIDFYNDTMATPWIAAESGYIDAVIEPNTTRLEIRRALNLLKHKAIPPNPRKHAVLPL